NRSNYLFCRIFQRKTVSHFCWKCSRRQDERKWPELFPATSSFTIALLGRVEHFLLGLGGLLERVLDRLLFEDHAVGHVNSDLTLLQLVHEHSRVRIFQTFQERAVD